MELAEGMLGLSSGTGTEEQVFWGTCEWGRFGGPLGWSGDGVGSGWGSEHEFKPLVLFSAKLCAEPQFPPLSAPQAHSWLLWLKNGCEW